MTLKNMQENTKLAKKRFLKKYPKSLTKSKTALTNIASTDISDYLGKIIANGLDTVSSIKVNNGSNKGGKKIALKNKIGWTQDRIPIDTIVNGVIKTTDKRYVQILEILPINFKELTIYEQDNITDTYAAMYKNSHVKTQLKTTSDHTNPSRIINYIYEQTSFMTDKKQLERRTDLINHIKTLAKQSSLSKRFFFIYEYEGEENGRKSKDEETILNTMYEYELHIRNSFAKTKNTVIHSYDRNMQQLEILYYLFNRKTSTKVTLNERLEQLRKEQEELLKQGIEKTITVLDVICPNDLNLYRKRFLTCDHQYYTYLTIKDESYPSYAETGWTQLFTFADKMDCDFYTHRMAKEFVKTVLGQLTKFQDAANYLNISSNAKQKANEMLKSNLAIENALSHDEDIYNLVTVLTIRADTKKELMRYKHQVIKGLKLFGISVEDTFLNTEEYFEMTMPLLSIAKGIFLRNSHNFITSSLGSMYPFTSYELFDPTGYVLGLNDDNRSLIAINNFNSDWFKNGNMGIMGTSGSGKTYSEQTIGQRMFFMGIRTHFIVPAKGYEYRPGCKAVGGSYIPLRPGSSACINVMDIIPEKEINKEYLDEEDAKNIIKVSSLTSQITFLITWIQLNLCDEKLTTIQNDELDSILIQLYNDFGFTDDDDSLYIDKEKEIMKPFPIIEDMYNRVCNNENLKNVAIMLRKYVTGSCKNMNGQTNVDLKNYYTVYDVDEREINKELFPAFMYLAYKVVLGIAKSSLHIYDAIFLDEIWKLLNDPISGEQIKDMVKVIRGYAGCAIIATQDISDFLNSKYGPALLGNTEIKLFLGLKETELARIKEVVTISPKEEKAILGYDQGYGMLFAKKTKVTVNIRTSEMEFDLFNTDEKKRRERAVAKKKIYA